MALTNNNSFLKVGGIVIGCVFLLSFLIKIDKGSDEYTDSDTGRGRGRSINKSEKTRSKGKGRRNKKSKKMR